MSIATNQHTPVKRVLVASASGHLGQKLIPKLIKAGLGIYVLTRETSTATFPSEVHVLRTDYTSNSLTSLLSPLKGKLDVAISLLAGPAISLQTALIDACIQTHVTRFVPSEFGANIDRPEVVEALPYLRPKLAIRQYLTEQADKGAIEWTALANGIYLDFVLQMGSGGFHLPSKQAIIWDGGKEECGFSTLDFVAEALVRLCTSAQAWAAGKNMVVRVEGLATTQNAILAELQKHGEGWNVTQVQGKERVAAARQKMAEGKGPMEWILDLLQGFMWASGVSKHAGEDGDNELLGLKKEDLGEIVAQAVGGK